MPNRNSLVTRWLTTAPDRLFASYAIAASFSTYFCMYAFRKPFAAATYDELGTFVGLDLKTALVISQICRLHAFQNNRNASLLGIGPSQSSIGPGASHHLGAVSVDCFRGRSIKLESARDFVQRLAVGHDLGTCCPVWMDAGVSDVWMPAITGLCFLPLYLVSVWLLNQVPEPSVADIDSRTERPRMNRVDRARFVGQFWVGLLLLFTVYFFLTAYRDFRDNYGIEIFQTLGYAETPAVFTRTEFPVAIGVVLILAALNVFRNHRHGLIAVYAVMTCGLILMAGATLTLDVGLLRGRELWWMVMVGIGSYLAYVPFGTALFERLLATTHFRGNAVFAIYIADSVGYTGSIAVQVYKDLFQSDMNRFEFLHDFTYALSLVGAALRVASCIYFLPKTHRALEGKRSESNSVR